jgi:hypothetical protein
VTAAAAPASPVVLAVLLPHLARRGLGAAGRRGLARLLRGGGGRQPLGAYQRASGLLGAGEPRRPVRGVVTSGASCPHFRHQLAPPARPSLSPVLYTSPPDRSDIEPYSDWSPRASPHPPAAAEHHSDQWRRWPSAWRWAASVSLSVISPEFAYDVFVCSSGEFEWRLERWDLCGQQGNKAWLPGSPIGCDRPLIKGRRSLVGVGWGCLGNPIRHCL